MKVHQFLPSDVLKPFVSRFLVTETEGDSEKISGPKSHTFAENNRYLDAFYEKLGIKKRITFVVHDWGSALAFDWARRHPEAVKGIAFMEYLLPFPINEFS